MINVYVHVTCKCNKLQIIFRLWPSVSPNICYTEWLPFSNETLLVVVIGILITAIIFMCSLKLKWLTASTTSQRYIYLHSVPGFCVCMWAIFQRFRHLLSFWVFKSPVCFCFSTSRANQLNQITDPSQGPMWTQVNNDFHTFENRVQAHSDYISSLSQEMIRVLAGSHHSPNDLVAGLPLPIHSSGLR